MERKLSTFIIIITLLIVSFGANGIPLEKSTLNTQQNIGENLEFAMGELIISIDGLNDLRRGDSDPLFENEILKTIPDLDISIIKVPEGEEENYKDIYNNEGYYATLNYRFEAYFKPNDPSFDSQWGPQRIRCPYAWNTTTGSSDVTIAIIDTGVDRDHPDLKDKIVNPRDFIRPLQPNSADDDNFHGTHCAGIAAAAGNNQEGIAGVAYDCKIMPVKVLDKIGYGYLDDIVDGIMYAANNSADVISMSLGIKVPESETHVIKPLEDACNYAWDKGSVLVAAAGNEFGSSKDYYPAAYDNVIAVTSSDQSDGHVFNSRYGTWVDFAAPGIFIYSTMPMESTKEMDYYGFKTEYDYLGGTSMACPHVAGVAALAISQNPKMSNSEIRNLLNETADKLSDSWWYDPYRHIGHGRIDATLQIEDFEKNPYLNFTVYKVNGIDAIDVLSKPEWYYKLTIASYEGGSETIYNYNAEVESYGIKNESKMNWNSEKTWIPDVTHSFEINVTYPYTIISLDMKLMEHDGKGLDGGILEGDKDDLADISGFDGFGRDERGGRDDSIKDLQAAMYEGAYNIFNDEFWNINYQDIVNKEDEHGNWWNVTSGENLRDGSNESDLNDAEIWFKVEDSYDASRYRPILEAPSSIPGFNIGETRSFSITNGAPEDIYSLSNKLRIEDVTSNSDWLSISGTFNNGLSGQQSHIVSLTADGDDFGREESKTATITISSSIVEYDASQYDEPIEELDDVTVQVTVTKCKAKSYVPNLQIFLKDILQNFPNMEDIFYFIVNNLKNMK